MQLRIWQCSALLLLVAITATVTLARDKNKGHDKHQGKSSQ